MKRPLSSGNPDKEGVSPFAGESQLLENKGTEQISYDSTLLPPASLSVLGSPLSRKIISELVNQPGCAMDIARSLGEHEQKIYYHLKRLEKAGIIRLKTREKRYGMTANIFSVVSPVIATKLHDNGYPLKQVQMLRNPVIEKFLYPFIDNGESKTLIIFGDPYPHGRFDRGGLDSCYVADLALLLGHYLNAVRYPCYKLDVRVTDNDMRKNNLIVIGGPHGNVITDKLNAKLPVRFDAKSNSIVSTATNQEYKDELAGVIARFPSPYNKEKQILLLAGRRTRGTEAAVIGFTRYLPEIISTAKDAIVITRVVHGLDEDGDGIIDAARFLE